MNHIADAAGRLVNKHKTRCPFELAEHLGIEIHEYPFQKKKGLIIHIDGRTFIGLKSGLHPAEKRTIVAHEIGHEQLHPTDVGYFFIQENTFFSISKLDRQANIFAAALLLDEPPEPGETIEQYAERKGVMPYLTEISPHSVL